MSTTTHHTSRVVKGKHLLEGAVADQRWWAAPHTLVDGTVRTFGEWLAGAHRALYLALGGDPAVEGVTRSIRDLSDAEVVTVWEETRRRFPPKPGTIILPRDPTPEEWAAKQRHYAEALEEAAEMLAARSAA